MASEDGKDPGATGLADPESIEEQVENGTAEGDDDQLGLGLLEGDESVTLKNLIERGMEIQTEVSIGSAAVPLKKGLLDPHRAGTVLVTYTVKDYVTIPLRRAGVITGWKIRVNVTPSFVEQPTEA